MKRRTYGTSSLNILVQNNGLVLYRYEIDADCACRFSMLCEVGQPWVPSFYKLIADNDLCIEHGVDMDFEPWCTDIAHDSAQLRAWVKLKFGLDFGPLDADLKQSLMARYHKAHAKEMSR